MGKLHRLQPVAVALLFFLLLSCVKTPRAIFRGRGHKQIDGTAPALKMATREELIATIARVYGAVQSFQATSVELTASQGSVYEGKITVYTAAPGFIFFRKPNDIRIRAYLPVLGKLAFDMVSNGTSFRFLMPSKNTLFEGLNSAPASSANKMENMRPDAFLSSMLIRPADPATEFPMLKDDTDEDNALYRIELNRRTPNGIALPGREIWFDRQDLTIVRQKVYDEQGDTVSDTSYSEWRSYNGVQFPAHIDINRRIDGYGVMIEVLKMEMNKEITNDKFELSPSDIAGAPVRVIR